MSDLIKDAENAASVASKVTTVFSGASGAVSLAGDAVKLATGAASGLVTGLLPYIIGAFSIALAGCGVTIFWLCHVTIPELKAAKETALAAEAVQVSQTQIANDRISGLQTALDDSNRKIDDIAKQCRADDAYADLAVKAVRTMAIPSGHRAADVNSFTDQVFARVKK